ncbi:DNA polymerase/3'-5' exonuclease PolX [Candidatus Poribacteria bacterium]|nr:DNA polymerase/3'-5' exonuclease PolX [Candidatus Poribacteria bacterium]
MDKKSVIDILEEIGVMLELKGESESRARAYYWAARVISGLDVPLETLIAENKLKEAKGIGKALSAKITELVTTGRLQYHENLKSSFPETLFELLKIPGMGPKRVKAVYEKLGIKSLGELEYACHENRLISLKGFGVKTQEKIFLGIQQLKRYQGQYLYDFAQKESEKIYPLIAQHSKVIQSSVVSSLRRKMEVIREIDILASTNDRTEVMDFFTSLKDIESVTAKGDVKSSVTLNAGINVNLHTASDTKFPYVLRRLTGSEEHNIAIRDRAAKMGFEMNEDGLFKDGKFIECKDESQIFHKLGLAFIPPELRENTGEIEAAGKNALPRLIEESDIKGTFHVHTTYSDGISTIVEMAEAAMKLGFTYLGISDHSQYAVYANGMKPDAIQKQHREIDALNRKFDNFKIFKGIEADILPDGSIDYDDAILATFDFVIASVHSKFNLTEEEMTKRIIKAIENEHVTMLAHPTGRLLLGREGYPVNVAKVIDATAANDVVIELNANPHRFDLDWRYCNLAKEKGVKISINTDAHNLDEFSYTYMGVGIARKGWLEAKDVINTMNLREVCDVYSR